MLESLEKLRGMIPKSVSPVYKDADGVVWDRPPSELEKANTVEFDAEWLRFELDGIAAEIDARFMELPVDADGVPIHVGDMLMAPVHGTRGEKWFGPWEVYAVSNHSVHFEQNHSARARECKHAEPNPTVESLMEEFFEAARETGGVDSNGYHETIGEYAYRLREAVRGE